MKINQFILTLAALLMLHGSYAQEISSKLLIAGNERVELKVNGSTAVDLYAQLRGRDYPIHFVFDGKNLLKTPEGKEVAYVRFVTTLSRHGRVVERKERMPMPFFPGDMWMPIETFDMIPILFDLAEKSGEGKLPKGNYEVRMEAVPVKTKGNTAAATLRFSI
jgi:hypothetical protein